MYKVYCNGKQIHNSGMESLLVHKATVELELGKTGSFNFTIYPNHPYYEEVVVMLSLITVERDGTNIFDGRVLKIEYGFHNEKHVSCEGALAFFVDSLIGDTAYYGSFSDYFRRLINLHNAQVDATKQFAVGDFKVPDFEGYEVTTEEYSRTFDELHSKIVDVSGGYLQTRNENGVRYIDVLPYKADASNISNQPISFGENLVDIHRETDGSKVFSAIVPLGAEVNGRRVDIAFVNDYKAYITHPEAVARYGLIHKVVIFEGISDPQELKEAAETYINENYAEDYNIEITVADVSHLDSSLNSFMPGQWVNVYSKYHFPTNPNLFLIQRMTIDILNPAQTKIVIGRIRRGLAESISEIVASYI